MMNVHQQKILNHLKIDQDEHYKYEIVALQLDQVMQILKMIEVNVLMVYNDLMMVNHKQQ
jgi:hypothetical protein